MDSHLMEKLLGVAGLILLGTLYALSPAPNAKHLPSSRFSHLETSSPDILENGCFANFSGATCQRAIFLLAGDEISRRDAHPMFHNFPVTLPNPMWNGISYQIERAPHDRCNQNVINEVSGELVRQRPHWQHWVFVLPDAHAACLAQESFVSNPKDRYFWFIDGTQVVASITCSQAGSVTYPQCELYAYPENGRYRMSLGFLSAVNLEKFPKALPEFASILRDSLPDDAPKALIAFSIAHDFRFSVEAAKVAQTYRSALQRYDNSAFEP